MVGMMRVAAGVGASMMATMATPGMGAGGVRTKFGAEASLVRHYSATKSNT